MCTNALQVFLLVPFLTGICDLIFTIYEDTRGRVANFQYFTPIVTAATMVSLAHKLLTLNN